MNDTKDKNKIYTITYIKICVPEHPYADQSGCVLEHRLVAERFLLTSENSIVINDQKYLHPDYVVHHIDFDIQNNIKENLLILTAEEHSRLHRHLDKPENMIEYCKEHCIDFETTIYNKKRKQSYSAIATQLKESKPMKSKLNSTIPFNQKYGLTIQEASVYFGIGESKMREFVATHLDAQFVLKNGNKYIIKREMLEEYLSTVSEL